VRPLIGRVVKEKHFAALDADEARVIAETVATGEWDVDLSKYERAESSSEERPGGRVDHTFVYERPEPEGRLADERYRLRLVVNGDRFTELTHFVKIPEAFERRFSEMRSKNTLVAGVSSGVVFVLYGGGAILGLFLLLRKRWVVWKPALYIGGAIAALMAAAFLSQWPLAWMQYDTAVSAAGWETYDGKARTPQAPDRTRGDVHASGAAPRSLRHR